jgi:hypothetical protein
LVAFEGLQAGRVVGRNQGSRIINQNE